MQARRLELEYQAPGPKRAPNAEIMRGQYLLNNDVGGCASFN